MTIMRAAYPIARVSKIALLFTQMTITVLSRSRENLLNMPHIAIIKRHCRRNSQKGFGDFLNISSIFIFFNPPGVLF